VVVLLLCKFILLLARKDAEPQRFIKTFKHPEPPSPDRSGYPFVPAFGAKDNSVEQVSGS